MPQQHGYYSFIFAARGSGAYIVDSLENTNINIQMSQRQKHTANINQIDINLTLLHWTYGASDMYDTFNATSICTIWTMIRMDGGFDNSNWSFHDKRCHTSWIGNITCPFFDGPSDIHNLPFFLKLFQWYLYCYKILCPLYVQWYHNVIKRMILK